MSLILTESKDIQRSRSKKPHVEEQLLTGFLIGTLAGPLYEDLHMERITD